MSFSFLGGLANLLPNYIQGQRLAVQDNWQDLMNYNKAQQGQLANAFTAATWQPRIDMFRNEKINSDAQTYGNIYNMRMMEMMRPSQEMQIAARNYYAPLLAGIGPESEIMRWDMLRRQPNLMTALMTGNAGNAPSIFGG